jgi:hypothetical protein
MAETDRQSTIADVINPAATGGDVVKRALEAVRSHLGMKVAYVSEFVEGRSVFREVDAPGCEALIKVGDSFSLQDVYCQHILEGRIPELMPDTAEVRQLRHADHRRRADRRPYERADPAAGRSRLRHVLLSELRGG